MAKKSRLFKMLGCCALGAAMLLPTAACGGGGEKTWEGDGTGKVVMSYLTMINEPIDLDKVEAAVNAKTKTELNIEVDFYPISVVEQSKYTTLIGGGERIDLMCFCVTDPRPYAEVNMIQQINDANIEKFAPDIKALNDQGYSLGVMNERGKVIGFSTLERQLGYGGSYVVRKSDLEKVGLAEKYTDQKKISYTELDEIFAALKKEYPDAYPSGNNLPVPEKFMAFDTMGTDMTLKSSGVLNLTQDIKSTKIVNFYETDEYKAYIAKMQEWNGKGYINPDALTTDQNSQTMFANGKTRGAYIDCWLSLRDEYASRCGEEVIQLQLVDPYYVVQTAGNGNCWSIGGTAKNPTAALRLLNAIMSDQELQNLLQWGIEGEHFDIVDKDACVIKFHGDLTPTTSGYYNTLGLYGNKNTKYEYLLPGQTVDEIKERNQTEAKIVENAMKRQSPANGFVYDSSIMTNTIYAVEAVINEYAGSIGMGQKTNYDAFIAAMKKAGIDDVIKDKQAQFDAWLNEQK